MSRLFTRHSWLTALILLLGCTEENQHTSLSGTLIGYINSFDRNGNKLAVQSNVLVRIEGRNETLSLTTDGAGKFETNLQTGTYDILLSKDGFGTHKMVGVSFIGGENPT